MVMLPPSRHSLESGVPSSTMGVTAQKSVFHKIMMMATMTAVALGQKYAIQGTRILLLIVLSVG